MTRSKAAVLATLMLGAAGANAEPKCEAQVGLKAPPFSISMSDGSEGVVLRKALAKGAPVVVVFWAYDCVPCTRELPMLQRLADELGDKVTFQLIHDGPDETRMAAKLAELKVRLPSASDDTRAKEQRYCVHELPRTYVLDREGIIRAILDRADEVRLRKELVGVGVAAAAKG